MADGIALVLVASPDTAEAWSHPDGLPADEYHTTLGFFGMADDADEALRDDLRNFAQAVAADIAPVVGLVGGRATMGEDDPQAVALLIESQILEALRLDMDEGERALALSRRHPHFVPHMTIGYGIPLDDVPRTGEVRFDRVAVWWGDDREDWPLVGSEAMEPVQASRVRSNYPTITFEIPDLPLQADVTHRVLLAPINQPSDDGRVIVDSLGWREPPLPFMASDSEMGHGDAVHVGNLTDFAETDVDGQRWVTATLTFDTDEEATEFHRLADEGKFNGVSIHMGKAEFWPVQRIADGSFAKVSFDELDEMLESAESEDDVQAIFDSIFQGAYDAEIAAATQVAIPAFPDSKVEEGTEETEEPVAASVTVTEPEGDSGACSCGALTTLPDGYRIVASGDNSQVMVKGNRLIEPGEGKQVMVEDDAGVLVAAGASTVRPPRDWFTDPQLDGPTPLTVTDDGQVFGHLALWDTCHTGFRGQCITAPKGADYSMFTTSRVVCDDGTRIPVGPLVVDDGHASPSMSLNKVQAYYADTKLAAAYVTVGEDSHGVWVAGSTSHKASEAQIETLRRHPLSGDWRPFEGSYRLIAAVSVNGPGFPVPEVLVAAGEPVGLITYGPGDVPDSDLALVASALEALAVQVGGLELRLSDREDAPKVEADAEKLLAELG